MNSDVNSYRRKIGNDFWGAVKLLVLTSTPWVIAISAFCDKNSKLLQLRNCYYYGAG